MSIDPTDTRHATTAARPTVGGDAVVQAYLLGLVDYAQCLALQQRLVYETAGRDDGRISLLICEHPGIITVGRQGSRSHVRFSRRELTSRRLELRWVNRGGGCLFHGPGQLAVYPIVPLEWYAFRVGDYLDRLQTGILAALADLRFQGRTCPRRSGIWGRSGQVAAIGAAVKNWTSYHGAYINVAPAMNVFRRIQSDPEGGTEMTSLVAERRQPVRMSGVREALVRRLSEAFGCARYHVFTGHPLLARPRGATHESAARAG